VNYDSPREIRDYLSRHSVALKKRWGQNFLISAPVREKLVRLLEIRPGDVVWEVGPGLGAITDLLVREAEAVVAFEVDYAFIRHLRERFAGAGILRIVEGDFLKTWEASRSQAGDPERIVGNLPYRSASGIVGALIVKECRFHRAVFTVQKELAERMVAVPRTKSYSSFSVLCQAFCQVVNRGDVNPGAFYPAPAITSTIVELGRRDAELAIRDRDLFIALTRELFVSRRKTIRNNLAASRTLRGVDADRLADALEQTGLNPDARAETLRVEQFVAFSNRIAELQQP
jgi:16S rRNA (adenine1518-N6/adenine1519-N6)-dimethyltransferase